MSSLSILAIETATEACSAALYHNGKISSRYQIAPQQHVDLILPMCDELLKEANISPADLSAVAFGRGPGSFTGVRIAAAVTQGIAIAHDLPVIPVSTLQALAQAAHIKYSKNKIIAGIDARMGEVYLGKFRLDNDLMILVDKEKIISMGDAKNLVSDKDWFFAGSAFQQEDIVFPSAEAIIPIANDCWQEKKIFSPEEALPIYLRDKITF